MKDHQLRRTQHQPCSRVVTTATTTTTTTTRTMTRKETAGEEGEEEEGLLLERAPSQSLSLLEEIIQPFSVVTADQGREAYLSRLRTFTAATYFAKPVAVSPLVCARFGWVNVKPDMIRCSCCNTVLAILFSPKLTPSASRRVANRYLEQMCTTAHALSCPFRGSSPSVIFDNDDTPSSLPHCMASVWDTGLVSLMEHPSPTNLLRTRLGELVVAARGLPHNNVDNVVGKPVGNENAKLLRSAVTELLKEEEEEKGNASSSRDVMETAATWALFGWTREEEAVVCSVCLARVDLGDNDDDDEERQPKRSRRNKPHPLQSHRYYCPFVCGFPSPYVSTQSKPYWEVLAGRTVNNPGESLSTEGALESVQELLRKIVE